MSGAVDKMQIRSGNWQAVIEEDTPTISPPLTKPGAYTQLYQRHIGLDPESSAVNTRVRGGSPLKVTFGCEVMDNEVEGQRRDRVALAVSLNVR